MKVVCRLRKEQAPCRPWPVREFERLSEATNQSRKQTRASKVARRRHAGTMKQHNFLSGARVYFSGPMMCAMSGLSNKAKRATRNGRIAPRNSGRRSPSIFAWSIRAISRSLMCRPTSTAWARCTRSCSRGCNGSRCFSLVRRSPFPRSNNCAHICANEMVHAAGGQRQFFRRFRLRGISETIRLGRHSDG